MIKNPLIEQCRVNKADREYQVWKRKPLSIELRSESVLVQKLEYIHYNPVKSGFAIFLKNIITLLLYFMKKVLTFSICFLII